MTASKDLTARRLIAVRDVQNAANEGATELVVLQGCVITPSARELLQQHNIALKTSTGSGAEAVSSNGAPREGIRSTSGKEAASRLLLFNSAEARKIKDEICAVGKKLWYRSYVDGNGGNISYRIGPNEVLCTPTLMSKFDLTPDDICMVDLEGNQLAGNKNRTSEIFLHLEIYKAVPESKAVVHCHPMHATAYAITGRVPPNGVIPEFEVFVGKVAISPYETPGTAAFAQTVLPYVRQHNTVLLSNHGIVCWADTVTHAEWYAEVVDTYCATLMATTHLGVPVSYISHEKTEDLLSIKKRLGLPDARFDEQTMRECQLNDLQMPNSIALLPSTCGLARENPPLDTESVIQAVTDAVLRALSGGTS